MDDGESNSSRSKEPLPESIVRHVPEQQTDERQVQRRDDSRRGQLCHCQAVQGEEHRERVSAQSDQQGQGVWEGGPHLEGGDHHEDAEAGERDAGGRSLGDKR